MEKRIINPAGLPKPVGFNHGILTQGGGLLFIAGQPGLDQDGHITAPGDIASQFQQAFVNLLKVIREAGGQATDLVKLTIFVTDKAAYLAQRRAIGETYRSLFGSYYPAATLVEVRDLFDPGAMVELDAIAVIPE